jgi:protein phosphatase
MPRLTIDRDFDHGPFDIIGDVHGCYDELALLLKQLGYGVDPVSGRTRSTNGRTAVFLGDLVDRGPNSVWVLRLVMDMVESGTALCIPGNHDYKLMRRLRGHEVKASAALEATLAQLRAESPSFRSDVARFLESLPSHFVLDHGRLVVAHAGLPEAMHMRDGEAVRKFALYGDVTGERDADGLPIRGNWAADYHGAALVVYGHTPVTAPLVQNNTINIDTGCAFGGSLTAYRYPENALVSVKAHRTYATRSKPTEQ